MSVELCKVESVHLGREDHGIFTFMIFLDAGGSGQGFGGYYLDEPTERPVPDPGYIPKRRADASGFDWIVRLCDLFACAWEKIPGRYVEVVREGHEIIALRLPKVDGGRELRVEDWKRYWNYKEGK